MGVGKKKSLAEEHIQKTDNVREEELGSNTTLGGGEVESSLFIECELTDEEAGLTVGRRVRLLDMKEPLLNVFLGGRQIGVVTASSTATVRERYDLAARKSRSIMGVVTDLGQYSNSFTVKVD